MKKPKSLNIRRKRLKTSFLENVVHPIPLLEALGALVENGDLEWFEYGKYRCTIKLTKYSGLDMILKEASQPVASGRPYVPNKTNDKKFVRKTKI